MSVPTGPVRHQSLFGLKGGMKVNDIYLSHNRHHKVYSLMKFHQNT